MSTATQRGPVITANRNRWSIASWVFMRVSAVLLVFLALGHFAIMHVLNDVHDLSLSFVAERWASLGWRVYDALLLGLALVHGFNGLRIVMNDYVLRPTTNKVLGFLILGAGVALIVVGTIALVGGVMRPA